MWTDLVQKKRDVFAIAGFGSVWKEAFGWIRFEKNLLAEQVRFCAFRCTNYIKQAEHIQTPKQNITERCKHNYIRFIFGHPVFDEEFAPMFVDTSVGRA